MKLSLNSINPDVFKVSSAETQGDNARANIVSTGRVLTYEYARKGVNALHAAMGQKDNELASKVTDELYREMNSKFQQAHLLYAARLADANVGRVGPKDFEEFKRNGQKYYRNDGFYRVLMGIYQDILTPILPRVFSEAVGIFADTYEVGFGETQSITIGSNDIPIFQDSAWGASRSVPRNRFYEKDYVLNPQPKTAQINAKWTQLVGNNVDFGAFMANITAGLYAKTLGMWSAAMTAAASNTSLIPSNLSINFSTQNWVKLVNRLSAVNNVAFSNIIAFGAYPALSQVLPQDVTGSTNVNVDAAIATLLGADYTRTAYLGEYMAVRLMPLQDAVIPGTQNTTVSTILPDDKIWLMAGAARRPLAIGYNQATPITLEVDASKAGDMEIAINLTTALDMVAVFSSKVGLVAI